MVFTSKLLVIANQTVDSPQLLQALRSRADRGPIEVTLVAPAPLRSEEQTQARLARAVETLTDAGIAVGGVRGDPDPMIAVADVWDPRRFDEVVVATLPGGLSRWLAVDLPRRVERLTGARVTHVVAQPSAATARAGEHALH